MSEDFFDYVRGVTDAVPAGYAEQGMRAYRHLVFIGAWSTTKIPMLLFEMQALGPRFALARLAIDIPGIVLIALALKALIPKAEIERMYEAAASKE